MVSYYYTDADRTLVEEIAVDYRERLRFDPEAKRGRHWRLDGEEVSWRQIAREIHGDPEPSKYALELRKLTWGDGYGSPRHRALVKSRSESGIHGLLKLLRERLDYWQGEDAPF